MELRKTRGGWTAEQKKLARTLLEGIDAVARKEEITHIGEQRSYDAWYKVARKGVDEAGP